MPSPDERAIEEAVERLDFRTALAQAGRAAEGDRERLRRLVKDRRQEAVTRAEQLAARIQSMARADHYEGLLGLAEDPETELLLALLSQELRRGAQLHLDGALRRRKRFRAAAGRHMKAASEALVLFDTGTALSEIAKVETRWLDAAQREELHALHAQADKAVAERLELETRTAEVLREHMSENPIEPPSNRRAGRSPRRGARSARAGCLGSALVLFCAIAAPAGLLIVG